METTPALARRIAHLCREAMDNGDERETLERLAGMCDVIGREKPNGKTAFTNDEMLRLCAGRIITGLQLDDRLTPEQLVVTVMNQEAKR